MVLLTAPIKAVKRARGSSLLIFLGLLASASSNLRPSSLSCQFLENIFSHNSSPKTGMRGSANFLFSFESGSAFYYY